MRIYLAGWYTGGSNKDTADVDLDYQYFLESYHYIKSAPKVMKRVQESGKPIFLDSGAYSMFTQGIAVDLQSYADFIIAHEALLITASNLDEIGQGKETESYANQKTLEGMGVKVQPVFHVRDNDYWLEKYLDEGYDYIFIGGMVPETTKYLQERLDHLWGTYLTDQKGMPLVKIHGFGLTVLTLMERYPWYSVDSTSWVLTGRFGSIFVRLPSGKAVKLVISGKSPRKKDLDVHYETLAPIYRKEFDRLFAERGMTGEGLRDDYWKRDIWNIAFFKDLCDRPTQPFFLEKGLF